MNIKDFLTRGRVIVDAPAVDKATVLGELSRRAAVAAGLPVQFVTNEVRKRDELGSTGIGKGVALPHARLREVKKTVGVLARLIKPVEFEAVDGEPVDIVFLLLLPAAAQLDQLNALAATARKLRDPEVLAKLRSGRNAAALFQTITT
jgi:PTS system nitrogen regulatory IIA component